MEKPQRQEWIGFRPLSDSRNPARRRHSAPPAKPESNKTGQVTDESRRESDQAVNEFQVWSAQFAR
jgi:hypothetical protein